MAVTADANRFLDALRERLADSDAALRGYFGFTPRGAKLLEDYPIGGLSEYLTASPQHLVKLPPEVSFEQGARFGYLGTSFAALRRASAGAGSWIAIHGITGTLGVGAVLRRALRGKIGARNFGVSFFERPSADLKQEIRFQQLGRARLTCRMGAEFG